jgi:hypothetical protein
VTLLLLLLSGVAHERIHAAKRAACGHEKVLDGDWQQAQGRCGPRHVAAETSGVARDDFLLAVDNGRVDRGHGHIRREYRRKVRLDVEETAVAVENAFKHARANAERTRNERADLVGKSVAQELQAN